jgi:hypothetical protein
MPLLEKLRIIFFNQLTFSVPHLVQFMGTTENLSFRSAKLMFHREAVFLRAYPQEGAKIYVLYLQVGCNYLDWQVSSAAQIFNFLSPLFSAVLFSAVAELTIDHRAHSTSSEAHDEADRTFLAQHSSVVRQYPEVPCARRPRQGVLPFSTIRRRRVV